MSRAQHPAAEEMRQEAGDEALARALTQYMTVLPEEGRAAHAPDLYAVVSESGSQYCVDTRDGSCTCPHARHRDVVCKHVLRCLVADGRLPVPPWANRDAIDDQLGLWCDGPRYSGGAD